MHLYEINREERHFGFLFLTALVSNSAFRKAIFQVINTRSQLGTALSPDDFDIYAEVAIFRDFWFNLGSHLNYTGELHSKRRAVLSNILRAMGIDSDLIDKEELFWTRTIGESKLWYPGKWDRSKIMEVEKLRGISDQRLMCRIRPQVATQSGR